MAARSQLGRMIERGYNAAGAMNLHDVVMEIHARAGSDRKAAALVGVHHRTWQRWRKGEAKPNILHLVAVGSAVRKVRAEMKPLNASALTLKTKGNDGRNRTIRGSQLGFGEPQAAAIERAYIQDGGDAAARAFMAALAATPSGQDWYYEYFEDLSYEGYEPDDEDSYAAASASAGW